MNWHVEFFIPGKKLEHTLTFIHSLKPEGLSVRPVAVAAKSQDGNQFSKIIAAMEANPKIKDWRAAHFEQIIGITRHRAGVALATMAKRKLIRRLKAGQYALLRTK
jgi:hypothetical protein